MRVPARPRGSLRFDMTPMIDVAFQLIIFFLLSSHFARQEQHLALDLPEARSGQPTDAAAARRVTIQVAADGTVRFGARVVEPAELAARLAEATARDADVEVRVRCDRTVPYRHVAPILAACTTQGVWNVSLAVHRPRGR